ncbi:MAG: exodeoxyribonuclease I, partial [Spirochaetaceae bacterium]|nr:exodeoxyribonuclease I [Spirochaetaceae bacterium]
MSNSILWYDLETFGLNPQHDRIAQFACIRTDENLEEIDEPRKMYCKPTLDYLPAPAACRVHGITPQTAFELGLVEYDFALEIQKEFSIAGTTTAGFNSINFDDEFIRHLFYRNLFDPYKHEYANGNSRWDIINLVRAAHDLRPEGIVWPQDKEGNPVFKLEALTKANGLLHESAHDALSDIRATIAIARLIKTKQPRLYAWYFSHRRREALKPLIDLPERKMLLHTSAEYTRKEGCTTLIAPVSIDPANRNMLVAIDLRFDPSQILELSVEEIRNRVFTKNDVRVPLLRIRLNHCPFLAPISTLSAEAAARLGLSTELCTERLMVLRQNPGLIQKMTAVFDEPIPPPESDDPENCLYSGGFMYDADKRRLARFHEALGPRNRASDAPAKAKQLCQSLKFADPRILPLAGRLFGRNFPETLSESERLKWKAFCASRIELHASEGSTELADYAQLAESEFANPDMPAPQRAITQALIEWKNHVEREVL